MDQGIFKLHENFNIISISAMYAYSGLLVQVLPKDEALDVGLDPEMKWFHLGFQKITWRIHLKWTEDEILFDSEWNELTKAYKLAVGDRCVFICTFSCQRFKLAVFHKDQAMNTYKHGMFALTMSTS